MLQNAPRLRKSAPWPPNISDEHVSCTAPATSMFADPLHISHACHHVWKRYKAFTFRSTLTRCTIPCACHANNILTKVLRSWCVLIALNILTSKRASHHISTLNFQQFSERGVRCTCWLRHALHATTARTFSTSQLPKAVRSWDVLCILTSKFAWHRNGVQLFSSHLAKWLCTRRFSAPIFRPSRATNQWKANSEAQLFYLFGQCIATFRPFRAPASSFFSLFLFSDLFSSSLLPSDSSHLCFSISSCCGKFDFETSVDN